MKTIGFGTVEERPVLLIQLSDENNEQSDLEIFREVADNILGCHLKIVFKYNKGG
jgi:hypothetical protein